MLRQIAWVWYLTALATCDAAACAKGTIEHSNRIAAAPCLGDIGAECAYECDEGFLKIGKHVCQTYAQGGHTFIDRSFFGGRCVRLCYNTSAYCPAASVPSRVSSSDAQGSCLQTSCDSPDATLRKLAKGNYALWQLARNNATGIYLAGVDLNRLPEQQYFSQGATGETGIGLTFECVADAMGWISRNKAQSKILLTLRSLSGLTAGFQVPRNPRGFVPTFIDSFTGSTFGNSTGTQQFALMSTDLMHAGIMFTKTYYERVDPGSAATVEISRLAHVLFEGVQWDSLLCSDHGLLDPNGTNIPMLVDWADGCSALMPPLADGYYEFNEEFIAVSFAWQTACAAYPEGGCPNKGIERMWQRWQARRTHTIYKYGDHPLLSLWAAYVVHLPYYLVHRFNTDPLYIKLFRSHWQAEWAYYNSSSFYAGEEGRYGLGAGPLDPTCADGQTYASDLFTSTGSDHCRMYSPYSVAGYLPANPDVIRPQLLALLASGEAVYPLPASSAVDGSGGLNVLWRKSLLRPEWISEPPNTYVGVTTVDVASELFGLSTLWLGTEFYTKNTNHWPSVVGSNPLDVIFV